MRMAASTTIRDDVVADDYIPLLPTSLPIAGRDDGQSPRTTTMVPSRTVGLAPVALHGTSLLRAGWSGIGGLSVCRSGAGVADVHALATASEEDAPGRAHRMPSRSNGSIRWRDPRCFIGADTNYRSIEAPQCPLAGSGIDANRYLCRGLFARW
jgi:hypothetical protein